MTFTEPNTVEQMLLDAVAQLGHKPAPIVREDVSSYGDESLGDALRPARRAIRAKVAGAWHQKCVLYTKSGVCTKIRMDYGDLRY